MFANMTETVSDQGEIYNLHKSKLYMQELHNSASDSIDLQYKQDYEDDHGSIGFTVSFLQYHSYAVCVTTLYVMV